MKRFIEGADREQSTLLPESLDEWIDDSNPVRAVDVFVDAAQSRQARLRRGCSGGNRAGPLTTHRHC